MKQIEITVRLDENMQSAISKLENQGFKKIRESCLTDPFSQRRETEEKEDDL